MSFSPAGGLAGTIIFAIIMLASFVIFGLEVRRLVALMLLGRPENRFDHLDKRIVHFISMVLGQRGVLRDPIPGLAHFFTFWGFVIIQFGLLNLMLGAFNASLPVLGGNRAFSIVLDIFVILVAVALIVFAFRRAVVRPRQLRSFLHGPWDGFIILGLILLVIVTLSLLEGFEYAASNGAAWTLIGSW